jgi:hypothetical protein
MKRAASVWVYVLDQRHGPVKVGCSTDPERRASELRYMANGPLSLAECFHRPDDARQVEWLAHWLLRESRAAHLEWFNVSAAAAVAAVQRAIQMVDAKDFAGVPKGKMPKGLKALRPRRAGEPMPQRDWAALLAEANAWAEANPEQMEAMLATRFTEV